MRLRASRAWIRARRAACASQAAPPERIELIRDLLLVAFDDIGEVRRERERLAVLRQSRVRRDVREELVPGGRLELRLTYFGSMPGYQLNCFTMPSACTSGLSAKSMNFFASLRRSPPSRESRSTSAGRACPGDGSAA